MKPHLHLAMLPLVAGLFVALSLGSRPADGAGPARELGRVDWTRDLDVALRTSAAEGRPVFVLFQEVPGCSTCVSFGQQVLGQPMLVEAIETEFVPVLVYNNRDGDDAGLLARFGEPAWNNPVVRFLDSEGRDLIERRDRVWTPYEVGQRMIHALRVAKHPIPRYLDDAVDELRPRRTGIATFGMHCFWSGEACLGALPGVLESQAGHVRSSEAVEIRFDLDVTSYEQLVAAARQAGCAQQVFAHDDTQLKTARQRFGEAVTLDATRLRRARPTDQKRHLGRSAWRGVELTPRQAVRVNAALAAGVDPTPHLSPRQRLRASNGKDG